MLAFAQAAPSSVAEAHGAANNAATANNAYEFGFNNPQFSDRLLHIVQERDPDGFVAQKAAEQHIAAPRVLRSMHVNSLTLAANSEVFRCSNSLSRVSRACQGAEHRVLTLSLVYLLRHRTSCASADVY